MIEITFVNYSDALTFNASSLTTYNTTNSFYLSFENDDKARETEEIIKRHGYKTEHTDSTIRVFNKDSFEVKIS